METTQIWRWNPAPNPVTLDTPGPSGLISPGVLLLGKNVEMDASCDSKPRSFLTRGDLFFGVIHMWK